ncbi:MAG: AIR synthase related protein [Candidatus Jacksonbacteria bacterium]
MSVIKIDNLEVSNMQGLTYKGSGVDYDAMDPFKRMCQLAGRGTAHNAERLGFFEYGFSRGESAFLLETLEFYLAHVEEGLGTKNLVADAMYKLTGKSYYDTIAQDTVAMIVNDMITLGALPISVAMHLAVGDSSWFDDEQRIQDLVNGWKNACDLAGCVWAGGETSTLRDMVHPNTAVLSGSAVGIIQPKARLISPRDIRDGDIIVLLGSSGIHANGLTMARKIAQQLEGTHVSQHGYLTRIDDSTYGACLLEPTVIYVPIIEKCLTEGVEIHYLVNITGHGWRKLMRPIDPFVYRIKHIPHHPHPVFKFMQTLGPISDEEAYGNLNMGAGFAIYAPPSEVNKIILIAREFGISALPAGEIRKEGIQKKVIIEPKNLEYTAETLQVR